LDQVYPVEGLKSFALAGKYRLRYPGEWLFDLSVATSKEAERERPTFRLRRAIVPDAAFGPPGGGLATAPKLENLSIVAQPVRMTEGLEELLGDPRAAFERLVRNALAPEGSDKTVEIIFAGQRQGEFSMVYEFEYVLTKPSKDGLARLHTWSAVTLGRASSAQAATRQLYTMTIVAPESGLTWERRQLFETSWRSFDAAP